MSRKHGRQAQEAARQAAATHGQSQPAICCKATESTRRRRREKAEALRRNASTSFSRICGNMLAYWSVSPAILPSRTPKAAHHKNRICFSRVCAAHMAAGSRQLPLRCTRVHSCAGSMGTRAARRNEGKAGAQAAHPHKHAHTWSTGAHEDGRSSPSSHTPTSPAKNRMSATPPSHLYESLCSVRVSLCGDRGVRAGGVVLIQFWAHLSHQ
jgi:hypothetical protein